MFVICPHCGATIDVSKLTPNTYAACQSCGGEFVVPDVPTAPPAAARSDTIPASSSYNDLAIASIILSIIGFFTAVFGVGVLFGGVGMVLGIVARIQIKANPDQIKGYGMALAGVILGILSIAIFIGIIVFMSCTGYFNVRASNYDAIAQSAGKNAKGAEDIFHIRRNDDAKPWVCDLSDLLKIDDRLDDDPEVTFIFGGCDAEGYTLTTKHAKGRESYFFGR